MATLTVWKFHDHDGAEQAEDILVQLSRQGLIRLDDAAVVTWPANKKAPTTRQLRSMEGAGALGGAFWGFLFGLLFFVPLLGMALGAAAGGFAGALTDVGIDDDFISSVRSKIEPGTSALFVMSGDAVVDKVLPELEHLHPELLHSNLTTQQETKLREVFEAA